jgi:thiamine biosynthesis lipoprotein
MIASRGSADTPDGASAFETRVMGSSLRLTLGRCADASMSRFRDDSDLTRLNRTAGSGRGVTVSARLRRALVATERARRVTGGRFDPRVLVDLDRIGYRGVPLPDGGGAMAGLASRGDWRSQPVVRRTDRQRIAIDRPIDLGGIGKGLALRWAATRLARCGIQDALLEAGGDLVTRGRSPGLGPWHVGIEDPAGGEAPLAVIAVNDMAVATSSTRILRWTTAGRWVHHLIDPRTGEPADGGLAAVTVGAADPAWAEVWSKALFVGGLAGIAVEARTHGLAAWWITDDGSLEMTAAARALTIWVAGEDR